MVNRDEFFDRLRMVQDQARRIQTSDEEVLQQFLRQLESLGLAEATVELEQRGLAYFAVPANQLSNPSFDTDLTNWTEVVDAGITGTTSRVITPLSKTLYGSLAALKLDLTASSGAGDLKRRQAVTATASTPWSFEAWVNVTALTLCKAVLKIEWLNGGGSVLSTDVIEMTSVTSGFELKKVENVQDAGAVANVRVSLTLTATASGASGTAYFDLIRAEENKATVSDRATRIIVGEWTT